MKPTPLHLFSFDEDPGQTGDTLHPSKENGMEPEYVPYSTGT